MLLSEFAQLFLGGTLEVRWQDEGFPAASSGSVKVILGGGR